MCLDVLYNSESKLELCGKKLRQYKCRFYTPYQGKLVPDDGWLFPEEDSVQVYRYGMRLVDHSEIVNGYRFRGDEALYGGCIHAMCRPDVLYKEAFAFRVFARGQVDIACLGMYIPFADDSGFRDEILGIIKGIDSHPSNEAFEPLFKYAPKLKDLFPLKQENNLVQQSV